MEATEVQMSEFAQRIKIKSRDGKIILSLLVFDDGDFEITRSSLLKE